MSRELPVWRSLMYVPVNVDKYVDKAHTRGADVIQLDVEDSVPPAEKEKARTLVEAAAKKVRRGGADVVVRINRPLSLAVRDLEHSICPDVDAIACTKVDSASHVKLLDELVTELEEKRGMAIGHTQFIAMVETADAFFRIHEIVRASPRIVATCIGGEDFALDNNMQPTGEALWCSPPIPPASCRSASSTASRVSVTGTSSARWCAARATSASWARAASIRDKSPSSTRNTRRPPTRSNSLARSSSSTRKPQRAAAARGRSTAR